MNWTPWRAGGRVPGLLTAPRPEPTQQADRIASIQRNLVFPAKLVIISIAFYYLYFSRGMDIMATKYGSPYEMMRNGFGPYVILNLAAAVTFLVVRRFPLGYVQGIVFVVGLADGLFLGGLTLLTGGFASDLYWVYAGMIVVNAVCIPLATPQIILNLLLTFCFLAAGLVERNVRPARDVLPSLTTQETFKAADFPDLRSDAAWLRRQATPLARYLWRRLSESTRQKLISRVGGEPADTELREALVLELNNIFRTRSPVDSAETEVEAQTQPFIFQLAVLWLLTFCCYGVQLLAARQRQALEEQREFLSRTGELRAAGRLAAEIAHKIKNPLGIINNAAFSLQRALRDGRPVSPSQLQIIQEEVERSDRIITQIMGYAQLNEGRVEKLNVAEELERAIRQVFPPAAGFAIEVKREIAADLPPLWMQPGHFNEIFVNLLLNAREVLNGVGLVTVAARAPAERGIEVVVEDNGPGIPADKVERIFEPYFSMREKGTGLGLAIVRHNVELYAGTVHVESALGKGARFVVFFPARASLEAGT